MIMWLKADYLKNVLKDAHKQNVSISICSKAGNWSEYFQIDDIRDVVTERGLVTIMVLHSDQSPKRALVDVRLISSVKFNKYLTVKGKLTSEISVTSAAMVPEQV
jgi:hypothetical protein